LLLEALEKGFNAGKQLKQLTADINFVHSVTKQQTDTHGLEEALQKLENSPRAKEDEIILKCWELGAFVLKNKIELEKLRDAKADERSTTIVQN
jgi:hypothetical protein